MKRFSFSLEKVRGLRKFREEETRIELGKAIGILSEIENSIKLTAQRRRGAALQRFSGISEIHAMLAWDNYIGRLDQETEKLLSDAAQAELIVEEKREIYLTASRELKVMDKLREKREKEYRKEFFAAETRDLDNLPRRGGESVTV